MAQWRAAMPLAEVTEGHLHTLKIDGVKVILVNAGDAIVAYADRCPHEGHPLSKGDLDGDVLICAKHLWEFDVRTGAHISRVKAPERDLNGFPVRVRHGQVEVDISAPRRPLGGD